MRSQQLLIVLRNVMLKCATPLILLAGAFLGLEPIWAIDFTIGAPEIVYTKSQRKAGGSNWPDGNLGVISNGDGTYDFYGANGTKPVMTTGTLLNPAISKKSVSITGVPKKTFSYLAGGPVFEDQYSGARLMIYHAEDGGKGKNFYAMLGMAISTDGQEFRDLGLIIRPNLPAGNAEVGGGSFAIIDGHLNVYYRDTLADGSTAEVAVARAPMAELMTNALSGRSTSFTKYYNGSWSEPGLGGRSAHIENVNSPNSWLGVSYNDHLGQLVLVSSQWSGDGGDLYYATSPDGVNWAPRRPLAVDSGEQFYPTIIGTGADPTHSDQSFYVYYTDSQKGAWSRWSDAQLRRAQSRSRRLQTRMHQPTLSATLPIGPRSATSKLISNPARPPKAGSTLGIRRARLANHPRTLPSSGVTGPRPTIRRALRPRSPTPKRIATTFFH